jgi:hypothetical protein
MLLNFGADPNLLGNRPFGLYLHSPIRICSSDALHMASSCGNEGVVRILLHHLGPIKTDADALDGDGSSAISIAARRKYGCVQALLETEVPLKHLCKAVEAAASGYRSEKCKEIVTMLLAKTGNSSHLIQAI